MRPDTASETPIACTLDIGGFKQRLAWIAELNHDALRSHESDGLVLRLRYDAKSADRVKEMVRRERQCCAFLRFDIRHESDDVLLTITAREEARIAVACTCAAVTCAAACVAPLALPAVVLQELEACWLGFLLRIAG
jgi:hypothetical protein